METAIVSGGTKGIGLAISKTLIDMGYRVLAPYKSDHENAATIEEPILPIHCDVTSQANVDRLRDHMVENDISPSVLVNNAGFNDDSMFWKMDDEQWLGVLDVTLNGAFRLSRMVVPFMRKCGKGKIINISSVVPQIGGPGTVNYSAAKAGLSGLAKSLAKELAPKKIMVNTLALGYFDGGVIESIPPAILETIIESIPLKRLCTGDDVSNAIRFLVSTEYMTGTTMDMSGGLY